MFRLLFIPPGKLLGLFGFLTWFSLSSAGATDARIVETYGKLPLQFEANRGQIDKDVRFLSRGAGYSLYLTASEAVLALSKRPDAEHDAQTPAKSVALRMNLVGASRKSVVSGIDELPGKSNYFIGKDRSKWRTNVPTYARVQYQNLYPGIDLVYYGNQRQLEYDFVVAPGADPKKIVLGFKGAKKLEIDAQGELVLHASGGDVRQHKPIIYQEIDGIRREIAGGYVRKGANRIGFKLAAYDASQLLVIDPTLSYSTYLGGSGNDVSRGIAVDAEGSAYIVGVTDSIDFPTTPGALQPQVVSSGNHLFVTKLNPTGSALVYSTYLGGSNPNDRPFSIAVDANGSAYLTGSTFSADFPTTAGAFQPMFAGPSGTTDAFVTKLDPTGSALVYSTYLGGTGFFIELGFGIAVDGAGNAYVAGTTSSRDFPTAAAFQPALAGGDRLGAANAFVTKLNPSGTGLVYSTYLGGVSTRAVDEALGIAVDAAGNAYVTGFTTSFDFPTTPDAFQRSIHRVDPSSLPQDAFVTKFDPAGSLVYSTYLGGERDDGADGIAVDAHGNAYVTGGTASSDFPTTAGAFQPASGVGFVTKLNPTGSALVYSTRFGGSSGAGSGIAVDAAGNAYVTGVVHPLCGRFSCFTDFPTTPGAFQPNFGGGNADGFVAKFNPEGSAVVYSSYLGGSSDDESRGIAVDASGNAYVTGFTGSANFPTTAGAFDTSFNGVQDAFITKIAGIALLVIDKDGIDDKKPPNFFSDTQVNDDVAALGVRAQLRFFRDQVGQTITLPAGAVGDEGWFALKTIPASWAQAGGAAGFVGNPAANPEDPAPQGTGPGLGAPDATGDPDSLLKNVPNVTPLGATALGNLIGRQVCAVVYDHQVGIDPDQRTGDLRGANLGTVAFQVVALAPSGDASSLSLPSVQVRIRDARTTCRGPFALLTDAEAP